MEEHQDPRARLTAGTRFSRLIHVQSCESTQVLAQQDHEPGSAAFWADHQTGGRGRQGHAWHDEAARDLTVTFKVAGLRLANPAQLAAVVPVAVLDVLEQVSGLRLTLKWPNDLMVTGRKIAGILIDSLGTPPVHLIGVGINVNRTGFPPELRGSASSLALVTGHEYDRADLLVHLAIGLDDALAELAPGRIDRLLGLFRERLGLLGRRVVLTAGGKEQSGRLTGLDFDHATLDAGAPIPLAIVQGLRLQ